MRIGFTGTQRGMRPEQDRTVNLLLQLIASGQEQDWFIHGGCVGGDEEAHIIACAWGWLTEVYWSDHPLKRANLTGTREHAPQPPLVRNPQIVEGCDILLAAPNEFEEVVRSGTWSTIRYAGKVGRTTLIVWPDGNIEVRHGALRTGEMHP